MELEELNTLFGLDAEDEVQAEVVDQQDGDATDEGAGEEVNEEPAGEPAPHQQTRQENQVAAQARRQAEERMRAAEEERDRAAAEVNVLKRALMQYGYEGSAQEIADAIIASKTGQTPEEVERQRMNEEAAMQEKVNSHPAVVQALQLLQDTQQQRTQDMIARELREIQKLNPDIKSIADLRNLGEDQEVFDALIKGGMHIDQAYREISRKSAPPLVKPDTKSHLRVTNGGSRQPAAGLSAEEIALCKEMMPGLTTKEINDWYAKQK